MVPDWCIELNFQTSSQTVSREKLVEIDSPQNDRHVKEVDLGTYTDEVSLDPSCHFFMKVTHLTSATDNLTTKEVNFSKWEN